MRDRRDELGELADSINAMADNISAILEAKRQLRLTVTECPARQALMRDLAALETLLAEQLSRLADLVYRADLSRQRGSGGVGLGLYFSRAIAQAHGGRLEIRGTPDCGTRV